jgi:hypothetical protein
MTRVSRGNVGPPAALRTRASGPALRTFPSTAGHLRVSRTVEAVEGSCNPATRISASSLATQTSFCMVIVIPEWNVIPQCCEASQLSDQDSPCVWGPKRPCQPVMPLKHAKLGWRSPMKRPRYLSLTATPRAAS